MSYFTVIVTAYRSDILRQTLFPQHKAGFINADLVSCNITLQLCITIIARNAVLKRLMTTRALARLLCA